MKKTKKRSIVAEMIAISLTNRTFFSDHISKHLADSVPADRVPIAAFFQAASLIGTEEDACRFLAGHVHWIRGKKPRTLEQALEVAKSNLNYCYEDGLPSKLWEDALSELQKEVVQLAAVEVVPIAPYVAEIPKVETKIEAKPTVASLARKALKRGK